MSETLGAAADDGWRHVRTGGVYDIVADARLQAASVMNLADMGEMVVYRSRADGTVWVRSRCEFHDGRFVPAAPDRSRSDPGHGEQDAPAPERVNRALACQEPHPTTAPTSLDLARIRTRALAATPGRWTRLHDGGNSPAARACSCAQVWSDVRDWPVAFCDTSQEGEGPSAQIRMANAAHIAGMDPSTTLAMVDEIERLGRESDKALQARAAELERPPSESGRGEPDDVTRPCPYCGHRSGGHHETCPKPEWGPWLNDPASVPERDGESAAAMLARAAVILDKVWPCGSNEMREKQGAAKWSADNETEVFAPTRKWLSDYRARARAAPLAADAGAVTEALRNLLDWVTGQGVVPDNGAGGDRDMENHGELCIANARDALARREPAR